MNNNLFQPPTEGEDQLYAYIRDVENLFADRKRLERMWLDYRKYAPKGFLKKLQIEFHQRWWEMYLTLGLDRLGLPITTFHKDDRPDLLLKFGDVDVWIEAVAPEPGRTKDAVPEPIKNGVQDLPMNQCLLRFTQALLNKKEAFNKYINKGIVSESDCCIIALSACDLNQFGTLLDFPQSVMLRVLAGAGDLVISQHQKTETFSRHQSVTYKRNGSPVDLVLFRSKKFKSVDGVLYSNQDPLNALHAPEKSFELFINPESKMVVPEVIRERMVSWSEVCYTKEEITWEKSLLTSE